MLDVLPFSSDFKSSDSSPIKKSIYCPVNDIWKYITIKAPKLAWRAELGKYLMRVDIDKKNLNCNMMTIEFNSKTLLTSIKLSFSKARFIRKG